MGRFIAIAACIIGNVIVSLMVVSLESTSSLTTGEERVFQYIITNGVKEDAKKDSAEFLITIFKLYLANRKIKKMFRKGTSDGNLMLNKFTLLSRMKREMLKFKRAHQKFLTYNKSEVDNLIEIKDESSEKIQKFYKDFDKCKNIERKFRRIVNDQKEIKQRLEELVSTQRYLANFLLQVHKTYKEKEL